MLLDQHHMLDQNLGIVRKNAEHAAFFSFVAAADHFHRIVAAEVNSFVFSTTVFISVLSSLVLVFSSFSRLLFFNLSRPKSLKSLPIFLKYFGRQ